MYRIIAGYNDRWMTVQSGFASRDEADEWLLGWLNNPAYEAVLLDGIGWHIEEIIA